jgi:hypothetical protein
LKNWFIKKETEGRWSGIQTFATTAGAASVALLAFFLATLHEKRKRDASWNRIKKELLNDLLDCYDKFLFTPLVTYHSMPHPLIGVAHP